MRILSITFLHVEEFHRIYHDASTPPIDRADLFRALRECVDAPDPREWLAEPTGYAGLLEFTVVAATSGIRYGFVLADLGHAADVVAYWREPPLEEGRARRSTALHTAHRRRGELR